MSYQYCSYLCYCDIHQRRYICCNFTFTYNDSFILIMFYYKLSQNFAFLTNIEYVHLCYFWTQQFWSRQRNSLLLVFDPQQQVQISSSCSHTKQPLKYGALLGIGQLFWEISWIRHKLSSFGYSSSVHYCAKSVWAIALDLIVVSSVFWLLI